MARHSPRLLRAVVIVAICGSLSACVVAPGRSYRAGGYYPAPVVAAPVFAAPVIAAPVYGGHYHGGNNGRHRGWR